MFIFNLKLNGNLIVKIFLGIACIICFIIFGISVYNIFFKNLKR